MSSRPHVFMSSSVEPDSCKRPAANQEGSMRKLFVVGAVLALAGCASTRGVEVGSEPSSTYAIEVTNNRSSTVTITYTDGGARIQLGTVGARQTERFIIASPQATNIT